MPIVFHLVVILLAAALYLQHRNYEKILRIVQGKTTIKSTKEDGHGSE